MIRIKVQLLFAVTSVLFISYHDDYYYSSIFGITVTIIFVLTFLTTPLSGLV